MENFKRTILYIVYTQYFSLISDFFRLVSLQRAVVFVSDQNTRPSGGEFVLKRRLKNLY